MDNYDCFYANYTPKEKNQYFRDLGPLSEG